MGSLQRVKVYVISSNQGTLMLQVKRCNRGWVGAHSSAWSRKNSAWSESWTWSERGVQLSRVTEKLNGVTDGGRRKLNGVTDGATGKRSAGSHFYATFNLSDRTNQNIEGICYAYARRHTYTDIHRHRHTYRHTYIYAHLYVPRYTNNK